MSKTKKGTIIWDENADQDLQPHVRNANWIVKTITPFDRGTSLKDHQIAKKYTKNIHPIFTGDNTFVDDVDSESGASGYVVHQKVAKGAEFAALCENVGNFFNKYSQPDIKNTAWFIPYKGEPYKTIENLERYHKGEKEKRSRK